MERASVKPEEPPSRSMSKIKSGIIKFNHMNRVPMESGRVPPHDMAG